MYISRSGEPGNEAISLVVTGLLVSFSGCTEWTGNETNCYIEYIPEWSKSKGKDVTAEIGKDLMHKSTHVKRTLIHRESLIPRLSTQRSTM